MENISIITFQKIIIVLQKENMPPLSNKAHIFFIFVYLFFIFYWLVLRLRVSGFTTTITLTMF